MELFSLVLHLLIKMHLLRMEQNRLPLTAFKELKQTRLRVDQVPDYCRGGAYFSFLLPG